MPLKFGFEPHWMDFRAPELNFSLLGVNLCLWGSIQGVKFGALWPREVDLTLVPNLRSLVVEFGPLGVNFKTPRDDFGTLGVGFGL